MKSNTNFEMLMKASNAAKARRTAKAPPGDGYRPAVDKDRVEDVVTPDASTEEGAIGFADIRRGALRALPLIVAGAALGLLAALAFIRVASPQYVATATVLYDPSRTPRFFQETPWLEPVLEHRIRIDSQVEILTSTRLAYRVIDTLELTKVPEFEAPGGPAAGQSWRRIYAQQMLRKHLRVRRVSTSSALEIQYSSTDPEVAANVANALAENYIQQELEIAADAQRRGSEWLERRLDELRVQLFEAQRAVEEFKAVGSSESLSEAQVRLAELESRARTYRALYESFLKKFTETAQRVSYPVTDSRVLSLAVVPSRPSFPNVPLVLAFAGMMGAVLAGFAAFARESLDRRIRRLNQIPAETGLACFPVIKGDEKSEETLIAALRPLRDMIRIRSGAGDAQLSFGVTGADASIDVEKLASAAARLWRRSGAQVLLVNAAPAAEPEGAAGEAGPLGLSDVLRDLTQLDAALLKHEESGVHILPRGRAAQEGELSDVATFAIVSELMSTLAKRFDVVIFALPEAGSLDTRAVAGGLEGLIIVATYAKTRIDKVKSFMLSLTQLGASVFGVVLLNAPKEAQR